MKLGRSEIYLAIILAECILSALPIAVQGQEQSSVSARVKAALAKGREYWQKGDLARAHSCLDDALQVNPKSYQLLGLRGLLNTQEGYFGKGVEDLKYAAIYARSQGKVEASQKLFAKALEIESMVTGYEKKIQADRAKAQAEAAAGKTQTAGNQTTKTSSTTAPKKSISSTARSVSQ